MIGTIRRHQKWLWMVIIAATIISFVYFLSPSSRNNNQGPDMSGINLGSINGEPITPDQFKAAEQEARILYRLNSGEWPDSGDKKKDLTQLADQRLMLNAELEEFHITPTPDAGARFI